MGMVDNFTRVVGTLLAILKTRSELIAIELEEEWVRLVVYLLMALTVLFCLSFTVFLTIVLVIVLCWDSYRIPAIVGLILVFGTATGVIWWNLRRSFYQRPKLFELTRQEIAKDIDRLTTPPA